MARVIGRVAYRLHRVGVAIVPIAEGVKMEKSKGQAVVDALAAWFASRLYLVNPDVALVLAIWAVGSWVAVERFWSWPYLVMTAGGPGAGKTTVLKMLAVVCRNSFLGSGPSPAFVLREIKAADGRFTLLWDEAEAAASDRKGFLSEVLNSGYSRGQWIGRASGKDETVRYPSYCAKAFAMIGDPTETVRTRSIIVDCVKGDAPLQWMGSAVATEGAILTEMIGDALSAGDGSITEAFPAWLTTRDREIWGSVFGLAAWLKLDRQTVKRLERYAAVDASRKATTEARRAVPVVEGLDARLAREYGPRALADLLSVFKEGERAIWSEVAVERLRAIHTAPWQAYRGEGLTVGQLADLVSAAGVKPVQCKMAGKNKNGYRRRDVAAKVGG